MRKFISVFILSLFSLVSSQAQEDFTKYVDPTIGNVAQFLVPTYPTMHLPNQMIRMFPVKYDYLSDQIDAFPLQVVTHRAKGILQMKVSLGDITNASWKAKMNIDHDLEVVHPWFYSTYLVDDDITVNFTPGEKSAIYKINFPASKQKNILIQGSSAMKGSVNDGAFFKLEEEIKYTTESTNPVTRKMKAFVYGKIMNEKNELIQDATFNIDGKKFSISFNDNTSSTVLIKYAVSYISYEQARKNLDKELSKGSFNDLISKGKEKWDTVINQIEVEGGTVAQKRSFYTALYRTYERMVDINEEGKYYSAYDGQIHQSNRPFYVDNWVWDSFRAHHPLRTILAPETENEMLNSFVLMYEQSGWMPTFPELIGDTKRMNSYHSSALFIDGYRKGLRDYDIEKAYEGIKKNLTEATFIPWRGGEPKQAIDDFYHENGYFPALRPGQEETELMVDSFEKRQSVAVTLGMSYDAWTMAELAKELGKQEDHKKFSKVAKNYENLWHSENRLFMPKDDKGEWIEINPKADGGPGYREFYDENNGWTYAWDVQHDVEGLKTLLGGKKAAEQRLDQLFREPLGMKKKNFYVDGANSTGMIGQFSMGNEPSFHIPYLYNYFGAPWKTQKRTRFLLDVWFKDNIFGIPGDEDGGGMSAFVVFTSMGLYPMTPGLPYYDITSPVFEKTTINLQNGKKFTVVTEGASKTKKYIQKAFINGKEISSPFITHKQIMDGGTLELILDELPNKAWGKDAVAPKY